ncbi:MAG: selenium-dependent molybdenum cofactor biosynthesis protein YqeB [bacterium]|nr:selenium-dependent molybdenum cofactor biosynthesis protein YqeB [bacterium]
MLDIKRVAVIIKGGGDIGTGVAHRLFRCGFPVIVVDIAKPSAVRRTVSFCEAIYTGEVKIEEVTAKRIRVDEGLAVYLNEHQVIPVIVDQDGSGKIVAELIQQLEQQNMRVVLVDAILAKRNLGTKIFDAELVIGLGPGFEAGGDVHRVIETNRGPRLGQVITRGTAEPNTGIPAPVEGFTVSRVLRAPADGVFKTEIEIGKIVHSGEIIGAVNNVSVTAQIDGIVRGLLKSGLTVEQGMKLGDIDPRGNLININLISDKSRAIAGGVLEAILSLTKHK